MDTNTLIAAAVPTVAVLATYLRNEFALKGLGTRIQSLETRMDARIETLDRDLREWARVTMKHNTDIARLKDHTKLPERD